MRAASASNGTGSNSLSTRCRISRRRARSACSSYLSCSSPRRTSCGPADSSARVMALIAISSGSSPGSIHLRKIKMLVSSRPWRGRSPLIPAASLLVERRGLVGSEGFQINCGSIGRHSDELWPGDESAPSPQRDQLPDSVAVTGDGKRLPVLDRVHDLPRPHPEVALRDLWVSTHHDMVALRAIWCYKRGRIGQAVRS